DLDNDTRTELVIVAAGAKSDLDDLDGARKLIEAEDFTQKPSGGLVRLMAAYAEVLRLYGETELADKYEELSRRTAKATGTLFGDEEPDLNAGVEIETVEEIEDEPEGADDSEASESEPVEDVAADDEPEAAEATAPADEPAEDAPSAAEPAAESVVESADAAPSTASEAKSEPEPEPEPAAAVSASTTHISAKELKSVKVTDEEIEAELDEILADAEADGDQ